MARVIQHRRDYLVQIELHPDEAESIAYALGLHDEGAKELLRLVEEARWLTEGENRG